MGELSSLGLTPEVLQKLIEETALVHDIEQPRLLEGSTPDLGAESFKFSSIPTVVYELNDGRSTRIEPQLRIWISTPPVSISKSLEGDVVNDSEEVNNGSSYFPWTLQQRTSEHSCEQDFSRLSLVQYVD